MNHKYYNFHNLLYVKSQLDILPSYFYCQQKQDKLPDLIIAIQQNDYFASMLPTANQIMPGIYFNEQNNILISKITLFGFQCFLSIKDFNKKQNTIVSINQNYIRFTKHIIRIPISSIFPIEHFIKLIINLAFLKKGAVMVLASGFHYKGKNFLISSFGCMGKTTLTMNVFNKQPSEFKLLSDDTCLFYKQKVFGYPQKIRMRGKGTTFFNINKHVEPTKYFKISIINSFKPDFLIFLEHSNRNHVNTLDTPNAIHRLRTISDKLFPLSFERNIAALNYIYDLLSQYSSLINNTYTQSLSIPGIIISGTLEHYSKTIENLCST